MGPATASPGRPASASPTCAAAWRALLQFTLWTIVISLLLSFLVLPWVDLVWWRVVRRCVSISAATSLWICVYRTERRSLTSYGLPGWPGRAGRQQFFSGVLLGALMLVVLVWTGLTVGFWHVSVTPNHAKIWRVLILFLPTAVLVSVLEELVFRGYLLQHLMACSTRAAVLVSSMLYAAVHLKNVIVTAQGMREMTGLCLVGMVLCLSYLRTGRLYMAIGLHAILAYGSRVNKLFIKSASPEGYWMGGTNRLVDGLLGWAAMAVLACLVWYATKPRTRGGAHAG